MFVTIEDILDAMEMVDQYSEFFLNETTGEIIMVSETSMSREEIEAIYDRLDDDGYFKLPTQYDIDDYNIPEDFVNNLPHSEAKDFLENAIAGRDAFEQFRQGIESYDLVDDWYQFHDRIFRMIAENWCIDNEIEYE